MNTFNLIYTDSNSNETIEKDFSYTLKDIYEAHSEVGWTL